MEYGRHSGSGNLADGASRPSSGDGAEFVGRGIRAGCCCRRHHAFANELAVRFFRRHIACAGYALDSKPGSRIGTLEAADIRRKQDESQISFAQLFGAQYRRRTLTLLLMNTCGMFGWWGLFTWIPPYLSLPVSQGGRGFGTMSTTGLLVFLNLVGMGPGYAGYGWVADRLGRRPAFVLYTIAAAVLVPIYAAARAPAALLVLGAVVAFFGTGFFSGSGIIGSELFPTSVRARALGLTYNGARALSSIAPFTIGRLGQEHGLDSAFYVCAVAFFLAGVIALSIPETRGMDLA
jgi:predicted MFS family arabinose efflux permease